MRRIALILLKFGILDHDCYKYCEQDRVNGKVTPYLADFFPCNPLPDIIIVLLQPKGSLGRFRLTLIGVSFSPKGIILNGLL